MGQPVHKDVQTNLAFLVLLVLEMAHDLPEQRSIFMTQLLLLCHVGKKVQVWPRVWSVVVVIGNDETPRENCDHV